MTPTPEQINEVLERAHDVILRYGWCQEWLETSDGRHCTLGAISDAVGLRDFAGQLMFPDHDPLGEAAFLAVRNVLHCDPFTRGYERIASVTSWNDADERTVDDVLDIYRMAQKKVSESALNDIATGTWQ